MECVAAVRPPGAAKYTGISTSTLAKMRLRGDGPAYVKLGPRAVAYRIVDLEEWLTTHRRRSTSESKQVPPAPLDAARAKPKGAAKSAERQRKSHFKIQNERRARRSTSDGADAGGGR